MLTCDNSTVQAPPPRNETENELQSINDSKRKKIDVEQIEDNGGVLHLGSLTFIHTVSKQMDRGERPTSEATREVGHALRGVSERGWEKEGRRGEKRERESCVVFILHALS